MFFYQDHRLSNLELEDTEKFVAGRSVSPHSIHVARHCRVQVPFTCLRIFLPVALLNVERALPCLMGGGSETLGINDETKDACFSRG